MTSTVATKLPRSGSRDVDDVLSELEAFAGRVPERYRIELATFNSNNVNRASRCQDIRQRLAREFDELTTRVGNMLSTRSKSDVSAKVSALRQGMPALLAREERMALRGAQ